MSSPKHRAGRALHLLPRDRSHQLALAAFGVLTGVAVVVVALAVL